MTVIRHNRRQFLMGIGGATLALPFLPSLMDKASAQAKPKPRMVMLATGHGAVSHANMFPTSSTSFTQGSFTFRQSALTPTVANGKASLSPVLTASESLLTPKIAAKMNTIMGLDVPFYMGHHMGGYLGNFRSNTGPADAEININTPARPTIDQILVNSTKFYESPAAVRLPAMQIGRPEASWGWSSPKTKSGDIIRIPTTKNSDQLFKNIYVAPTVPTGPTRTPALNRVYESYKRLHDGAFGDALKISSNDRRRLSEHMESVQRLMDRMGAVASCENVTQPPTKNESDPGIAYETIDFKATIAWYQVFNDIIATAFKCGTSRIAVIQSEEQWSPYSGGSWHQNVAHTAGADPNTQAIMAESNRVIFESMFLDLVNKLDVEEADGQTYLDNSLVWWVQESGFSTHDPISMPIITAGSAAGWFKTGYAMDYRRLNGTKWNKMEYPGLLYAQWLANILQAMGLSKADYQITANDKGYSNGWRQPEYGGKGPELWPDAVLNVADDPLPLIGKS